MKLYNKVKSADFWYIPNKNKFFYNNLSTFKYYLIIKS